MKTAAIVAWQVQTGAPKHSKIGHHTYIYIEREIDIYRYILVILMHLSVGCLEHSSPSEGIMAAEKGGNAQ